MEREVRGNILLLEDKIQMQKLFISSFIKIGIEVILVQNTVEMMNKIENNVETVDLLIIDIDDISLNSALDSCKKLRMKYNLQQLPIIFITRQPNPQTVSSAFAIGCNDFIAIPFNSNEFIPKVKFLIETKKTFEQKQSLMNIVDTRTQVFSMNTHDLKNPLSSIFSLSGIPVESFKDNAEISQVLKVIHDSSKLMMSLINQNLEYIKISSNNVRFEKEVIDITGLINQIVEMNNPLAKDKNQTIIFNFPHEDCVIISDHIKIYQAINNIVGNAIKFSPPNKKIWITVAKIKSAEGNKIQIRIKDEGPGFSKEEVNDVFVKFGKHSAAPTGNEISTGLGLLITKQIINASNGKIFLQSEESKGAEFIIEFKADEL